MVRKASGVSHFASTSRMRKSALVIRHADFSLSLRVLAYHEDQHETRDRKTFSRHSVQSLRRCFERHEIGAEAARLDGAVQHAGAEPDAAGEFCGPAQTEPQVQTNDESAQRRDEIENPLS